jgi:hypothetical protein
LAEIGESRSHAQEHASRKGRGGGLPIVLLVVALLIPLASSLFMFAALRGLRASAE